MLAILAERMEKRASALEGVKMESYNAAVHELGKIRRYDPQSEGVPFSLIFTRQMCSTSPYADPVLVPTSADTLQGRATPLRSL